MNIFNEFTKSYASSVRAFDPLNLRKEHSVLINKWKAPNEKYLCIASHNKNANDIEIEQLEYLIQKCRICPKEERYKSIIILMYRLYKQTKNISLIDKAKWELIPYLDGVL